MARLKEIKDPLAGPALAALVRDSKADAQLRLLCIKVLGDLRVPAGVNAFIEQAIEDSSATIRDACLDELVRFGGPQASAAFVKLLTSPDNKKVNRAALGLGRLKDPEATLPLIEALVTEHKFIVQPGGSPGQMNLNFGGGPNAGGSGFSAGGAPKVVKQQMRNDGALSALVAIHSGFNFAYDQDKWRSWFISTNTPAAVDLRRDH